MRVFLAGYANFKSEEPFVVMKITEFFWILCWEGARRDACIKKCQEFWRCNTGEEMPTEQLEYLKTLKYGEWK